MSSNVTETDTFSATVPAPAVADTTYPAVVLDALTKVASRCNYLLKSIKWDFGSTDAATFDSETEALLTALPHPQSRLGELNFWTQTAKPLVGTVKYLSNRIVGLSDTQKIVPVGISPINVNDPDWLVAFVGGKAVVSQMDIGGAAVAHFDLPVPLGGFLRNVTVWCQPLTGITHSGMPANKPTVTLSQISAQAGGFSATTIGSVTTDPSASTGAYDVLHGISVDVTFAMTQTLSTGGLLGYRIAVTGESGANAVAQGFCIAAITAKFARA